MIVGGSLRAPHPPVTGRKWAQDRKASQHEAAVIVGGSLRAPHDPRTLRSLSE